MRWHALRYFAACATVLLLAEPVQVFAGAEAPTPANLAAFSKIDDVQISPDGEHIAFTYRVENNEVRLAIAKSDLSEVKFVLGYGEDNHLGQHFWASNDRIVAWQWKNFGFLDGRWQRQQLIGFDIDGRNRETLFVPERSFIQIISHLDDDPERILVGKYHYKDEGAVSLNHIDVMDGDLDYIGGVAGADAESEVVDVAVDTKDEVRVSIVRDRGKDEYDPDDDKFTFHYRSAAGEWRELNLVQKRRAARYDKLGFSRDDRYFYFASNYDMPRNEERDTMGVFRFDFESAEIELEFRHPHVDVQEGIYGPDGELLGVRYQPGYPDKHYFDEEDPQVKLLKAFSATFPGQEVLVNNYTADGKTAVIHVYSDRNPGQYYLYRDGRLKLAAESRPDLDTSKLAATEAFTLNARDGTLLYGFLTLPPGGKEKDLPLVVHPHGGPHGPYDRWGYNPHVQALATNGYAVLQVNFRGSGGFGQDFEESGYGKWGREMQDDVTDATLWAVKQGIADRDRICITGGSYGGYATLQALVREPDLYACGIGVAGVYSLPMMWKKGDMREQGRRRFSDVFLKQFIGEDEAELKQYSPAYNVDRIKAAVFLIHGSEDVRVPIDQAEFLREQLEAAGKPFEWMVRKEGHGFTKVENRKDEFEAILQFLDAHIGAEALASN